MLSRRRIIREKQWKHICRGKMFLCLLFNRSWEKSDFGAGSVTFDRLFGLQCHRVDDRLQNSPYFWVFKYARAVKGGLKQRARLGRDAKNTFFFSLASHARSARKTLTPHFTDFFTDFEKNTDCFAVYVDDYSAGFSKIKSQKSIPVASEVIVKNS